MKIQWWKQITGIQKFLSALGVDLGGYVICFTILEVAIAPNIQLFGPDDGVVELV